MARVSLIKPMVFEVVQKIRCLPLARYVVVSALVCLVISAAVCAYLSYHFFHRYLSINYKLTTLEKDKRTRLLTMKVMEKESELQQNHFKNFSQSLKFLQEKMAQLQQFSRELQEVNRAGLQPKRQARISNVGGPVAAPLARAEQEVELREEILNRIYGQIEDLQEQISEQEKSFQEIKEVLQDQKTLLATTPSLWPTQGWITSSFGQRPSPFTGHSERHGGIDIASYQGTPVRAPADGRVIEAGYRPGYGNFVAIDHGHDTETRYGHNSTILVRVGQQVKRGEIIARVGSTGRSTGPHLHYEVVVKGVQVDPMAYILD